MIAILSLGILISVAQTSPESTFFDCRQFDKGLKNDDMAKSKVVEAVEKSKKFKLSCISTLLKNNMFQTNDYLLNEYFYKDDTLELEKVLEEVKVGINTVNVKYDSLLTKIHDELKKPIVMAAPFHWAQSLNQIEMEIKFAYRFDVAGCADLFNETTKITKDVFLISASCKELDQTMFFRLHFKLWDEIDPDTVKIEKRPVGKLAITIDKLTKPARWKQLWLEDTPKPQGMRLWFDRL